MNNTTAQPPSDDSATPAVGGATHSINMADAATIIATTTPNSKPRPKQTKNIPTYVYQDYANAELSTLNPGLCHERVPPQSLQIQKLPSKLACMLEDPDFASIITWMPHGRSWKILNRELFSNFALPRYFGHSKHASFVRIVNAWGFRRVTKGTDRDSYYHELFLRGKPFLHERMKRLPTCHRKTPVDKDDKCPDFYELAKTSPLPHVPLYQLAAGGGGGSAALRASAMKMNPAGYLGNPMAVTATTHSLGLGNHTASVPFGNGPLPSSAFPVDSHLSNPNKQENDISSFLKIQQEIQQGSNDNGASNAINQKIINQLLSIQHTHLSQQNNQTSSVLDGHDGKNTQGEQLANVPGTFSQPPSTTPPDNDALFNSFPSSSVVNGILPRQPQRRLSEDKISMKDVIELRSIERTNEFLAKKLASMQRDTMDMKQNAADGAAANAAGQSSVNNQSSSLPVDAVEAPTAANGSSSATPLKEETLLQTLSKEEALLQMIRRENQMNEAVLSNQQASVPPTKMSSHAKLEEGTGGKSQGLNHFLKSLTSMQQPHQQRTDAL